MANKKKKSGTTKRNSNTKKTTKKKINNKLPIIPMKADLIILICLLLVFIIGIIFMGPMLSLVFTLGLGLILLFTRLLDKTRTKKKQRKIINIILFIILVFIVIGIASVTLFFTYIIIRSPKFNSTELYPKESSIIYDKDGNEIRKVGAQLRDRIEFKDLSEVLVDALVATEDSRFFQHNGIDAPRFSKAVIGQLLNKSNAGGGSTLSMQVVKNSFTSSEKTGIEGIIRKFTDIYLAVFKLEKNYSKEEIIEFYLNNHSLGYNSYGVEQASQTYFGKSASELTLSEAALLVGMYNAPTAYNPYLNPENAARRRNTVLYLMKLHGYISQEEMDVASAIPVESLLTAKKKTEFALQSYVDQVVKELKEKRNLNPNSTPLLIYTNLDTAKQKKLDDIYNGVTFKWKNDVIQSSAAVVEVKTGKIVALAGGRNIDTQLGYSLATDMKRQIGSTAKPIFDYGPGIEYEGWSTYTQFDDSPHGYTNGKQIVNSDGTFMGNMSIRTALALSRNIPALKAFQNLDNKKINEFVTGLGITPEIENGKLHEAHALGAFTGSNPLEMATAYAAFANGGYYIEPLTVSKVVFRDSGNTEEYEPEKRKVMSDATAFMITDCLRYGVEHGYADIGRVNGINLAAKTGTTSLPEDFKKARKWPSDAVGDSWMIGYDPEYSIGLWYGYEKFDSEGKYYSRSLDATIWLGRIFRAVESAIMTKDKKEFTVPNSVVKVGIEKGSPNPGYLPSSSTPEGNIVYEYYKKGTEPTEESKRFNKMAAPNGLSVNYNTSTKKLRISWNPVLADGFDDSYGTLGYNVYYNDTLLGFTTQNQYIIDNPTTVDGTYKVLATFEKDKTIQGNAAIFEYKLSGSGSSSSASPGDKVEVKLNGSSVVTTKLNQKYTDPQMPIDLLLNGTSIAKSVNLNVITVTKVTDSSGNLIDTFRAGVVPNMTCTTIGSYKFTYTFTYSGKEYSITRTVNCTN